MSIFGNFISVAKAQIIANSTYITNSDNVLLTNNVDIVSMPDTSFPRIEFWIESARGNGYESQREINWIFRFWITGYLRRVNKAASADNIWTEADFLDIWDFGTETMSILMGLLDYKQSNPSELTSFQFFEGDPELIAECEYLPYISTFMGRVDTLFIKGDTDE